MSWEPLPADVAEWMGMIDERLDSFPPPGEAEPALVRSAAGASH